MSKWSLRTLVPQRCRKLIPYTVPEMQTVDEINVATQHFASWKTKTLRFSHAYDAEIWGLEKVNLASTIYACLDNDHHRHQPNSGQPITEHENGHLELPKPQKQVPTTMQHNCCYYTDRTFEFWCVFTLHVTRHATTFRQCLIVLLRRSLQINFFFYHFFFLAK